MKLLFDQNLSPRLPRLLADIFPDSAHVRELGMKEATDTQIWAYAQANDFARYRVFYDIDEARVWCALLAAATKSTMSYTSKGRI